LNTTPQIFLIQTGEADAKEISQKMPLYGPITQHEEYAITGQANQDEDFGVLKHDHKNRPNTEPKGGRRPPLRDGQRGVPPGIKYHPQRMAMQAAPDHGNHE
jgi:hypothetical protein